MKKLLAVLLIISMSISMLVGCGGSGTNSGTGNNSGTSNNDGNNQQGEKRKEVTVSYNATDYEGNTVKCELTYDSSLVSIEGDATIDLSEQSPVIKHIQTSQRLYVHFNPEYYSAGVYYEEQKEQDAAYSGYKEVVYSELTKKTIGSMEVEIYAKKAVLESGESLAFQYWLLQFKEGIIKIECMGNEEDLKNATDSVEDFLIKVTLDGKEPHAIGYAYQLCDFNTYEPLYIISYDPKLFEVDEYCIDGASEMILNYVDTSHAYQQMEIHVNEYSSGLEYFESKYGYFGSVLYEVGADGKVVKTAGKVGDESIYIGFARDKKGRCGYVFFIEMPDGNVITGHIPNATENDAVDIVSAFLSIQSVE